MGKAWESEVHGFQGLNFRNIHQANLSVLSQCFSDLGSPVGTSLPYLARTRVLGGITENDISRWSEMQERLAKTLGIVLGGNNQTAYA